MKPGKWIRTPGSDVHPGELIIKSGEQFEISHISLLIALGVREATVQKPPKIAILSSGNEILDIAGTRPRDEYFEGMIYDTNQYMLGSLCEKFQIPVQKCGICVDEKSLLKEKIVGILDDPSVGILITSGGVSMGSHDLIKPILEEIAEVKFGRVSLKPGKPTTFAVYERRDASRVLIFGLPGNPVSCFVTFHLLVLPAVYHILGRSFQYWLGNIPSVFPVVSVKLAHPVIMDPERPEFHRAEVVFDMERKELFGKSCGNQRSSRLLSIRNSNAFLVIPMKHGILPCQGRVDAIMIGEITSGTVQLTAKAPVLHKCSHFHEPVAKKPIRVELLVCSDRCSRGEVVDKSGRAVYDYLTAKRSEVTFSVSCPVVVEDDMARISTQLVQWCDGENAPDIVFTIGGTGFTKRDVTPEATRAVIEKDASALVWGMIEDGRKTVPTAVLSRATAGIRKNTLIVNLVGSVKGCVENIESVITVLPHAVRLIKE